MANSTEWLSEFPVITGTAAIGGQSDAKIVGLSNGGFVGIWVDSTDGIIDPSAGTNIIAKVYDAQGGIVRDPHQLNSNRFAEGERDLDVTSTHDGFAIGYIEGSIGFPSATSVRYERFNLTGDVIESLSIANENVVTDFLRSPQIVANLSANHNEVFGAEFAAAQNSSDLDRLGDVAALSNGNFETVYEEADPGGTTQIDISTSLDGRIPFTRLDETTNEIVASIWDPDLSPPPTPGFARDDAVRVSEDVLDDYGSDWFRIGYAKNNTNLLGNDAGAEEIVKVNGALIDEEIWFDGDNGGQFRVFAGGVVDFRNQGVKVEDGDTTGFSYTASDGSAEDMANVSVTIDAGADIARDDVFEVTEAALNSAGSGWFRLGAQRGDTHLLANDLGVDEFIFVNDPPLDEGVWFDGDNGGQFRTFPGGVVDFRNEGETVGLGDTTGFTYTVFQDGVLDTATVSMTVMETVPLSRPLQLKGIDPGDNSGFSVSSAGDVDGDGLDDVIIGARFADRQGKADAGESYLVFGATLAAEKTGDGVVDLGTLTTTEGILIRGDDAKGLSGGSVSSAGDVDGDGLDDVIIGAGWANPDGKRHAGESYLVFGAALEAEKTGDGAINFRALATTEGIVIKGIDPIDISGYSVSSAGDVDGDGLDDVIIGAPWAGQDGEIYAGESYLVFGAALAAEKTGDGEIDLGDMATTEGIVIKGVWGVDYSGWSVSSAGDVDGDGLDDVIIGAYGGDPDDQNSAGKSYLVFGAALAAEKTGDGEIDLGDMATAEGIVIKGADAEDRSGWSVSSAGDVDGDGLDDVIIGAYRSDPYVAYKAGESYLVFGATLAAEKSGDGVIDLGDMATTEGIVIKGIETRNVSGYSVSSAGDVDGDGFDDVIVGAFVNNSNGKTRAGESYIVFGAALAAEKTGDGEIDLGDMAATEGIIIKGIDAVDYSGYSVSSAGDVDGDGLDDMIIGAYEGDPDGKEDAGESYIIFGAMLTEEKFDDGIIDLGDWFF